MLIIALGQEAKQGSFGFSIPLRYAVCSHKNHLIEAILMSTHNIPFAR